MKIVHQQDRVEDRFPTEMAVETMTMEGEIMPPDVPSKVSNRPHGGHNKPKPVFPPNRVPVSPAKPPANSWNGGWSNPPVGSRNNPWQNRFNIPKRNGRNAQDAGGYSPDEGWDYVDDDEPQTYRY